MERITASPSPPQFPAVLGESAGQANARELLTKGAGVPNFSLRLKPVLQFIDLFFKKSLFILFFKDLNFFFHSVY